MNSSKSTCPSPDIEGKKTPDDVLIVVALFVKLVTGCKSHFNYRNQTILNITDGDIKLNKSQRLPTPYLNVKNVINVYSVNSTALTKLPDRKTAFLSSGSESLVQRYH